jgi:hydrogenase expression/formation protein HypC
MIMCLGIPGKVNDIRHEHGTRMATVDFGGVTKDVCLAFAPEVEVGDYVIVHAGFAITKVDEAAALDSLQLFAAMSAFEPDASDPDASGPPTKAS